MSSARTPTRKAGNKPASTPASLPAGKPAKKPPSPRSRSAIQHRNLPLLLLHARESVIAHFRPLLNEHGLTEQQWRVVRALLEHGPLEPRQIVQRCRISSPSLAGVLARMDEMGLVTRERLGHDQRRVLVTPSARSRALAASMAPRVEAVYAAIEADLGADFVEGLYATLDLLVKRLGAPAGSLAD
jgi:homoprotocatechuate degradation regulator HpaR